LYCIICGKIGNLLCCESCPNVVHPECVGLANLPEGDWFCEECNPPPATETEEEKGDDGEAKPKPLPFGRLEFDSEQLDRVSEMLEELRSARPTQKTKKKKVDSKDDGDDDVDDDEEEGDEVDASRRGRGKRLRRSNDDSDDEEAEEPPRKRRRRTQAIPEPATPKKAIVRTSLEEKRKNASDRKKKGMAVLQSGRKRRVRRTEEVDDPFEILSDMTKEFLRSIGINTADAFLETRTTDIAPKFVRWRRREGMPVLKGSGPTASVSAWKTSVRTKAEELGL